MNVTTSLFTAFYAGIGARDRRDVVAAIDTIMYPLTSWLVERSGEGYMVEQVLNRIAEITFHKPDLAGRKHDPLLETLTSIFR